MRKARKGKSRSGVSQLNDMHTKMTGGAEIEREWKSDGILA